jgi:hypothetical protein
MFKVVVRPIARRDPIKISDIIARVAKRRFKNPIEPNRVAADRIDIIKFRSNTRQVADPVAVRCGKVAARHSPRSFPDPPHRHIRRPHRLCGPRMRAAVVGSIRVTIGRLVPYSVGSKARHLLTVDLVLQELDVASRVFVADRVQPSPNVPAHLCVNSNAIGILSLRSLLPTTWANRLLNLDPGLRRHPVHLVNPMCDLSRIVD